MAQAGTPTARKRPTCKALNVDILLAVAVAVAVVQGVWLAWGLTSIGVARLLVLGLYRPQARAKAGVGAAQGGTQRGGWHVANVLQAGAGVAGGLVC